jgi:hypothetical protein
MTPNNAQLVDEAVGAALSPEMNIVQAVNEDPLWDNAARYIDPEAKITFPAPDGGFVGGMGGEFRGLPGLREGWREWVGPWEDFRVEVVEAVETDSETVLLLVQTRGRMRGAGAEIEQPAAAVYKVREGTIVAIAHFLDHDQARRAAGLEP